VDVTPDHPLYALRRKFEVVDGYWIPQDMVKSSSSTAVCCTNNVIIARGPEASGEAGQ
jgi:hypothetical protein